MSNISRSCDCGVVLNRYDSTNKAAILQGITISPGIEYFAYDVHDLDVTLTQNRLPYHDVIRIYPSGVTGNRPTECAQGQHKGSV